MIDSGNGSPIPVIVRASNIVKANQAVYLLFNDADLSWEFRDPSACLEGVGVEGLEATKFFILHFLGHQSGKELKLSSAGFSRHKDFEYDMRKLSRCVYDIVFSQLQPESWNQWMTSGGLEIELMHSNWCMIAGSDVQFRVRFVGYDGDILVSFCNRNEPTSLFIIVRPSPKWFEGLVSINQAYRLCKRAEELSNALNDSKQRTMSGLIFVEQCQQEHRNIQAALRKFFQQPLFSFP
jgi:hypothetical protein